MRGWGDGGVTTPSACVNTIKADIKTESGMTPGDGRAQDNRNNDPSA